MNIYDSGGSMLNKLWGNYDSTIEEKIVFDKQHCDFKKTKS
jgi:hypothetical protein